MYAYQSLEEKNNIDQIIRGKNVESINILKEEEKSKKKMMKNLVDVDRKKNTDKRKKNLSFIHLFRKYFVTKRKKILSIFNMSLEANNNNVALKKS